MRRQQTDCLRPINGPAEWFLKQTSQQKALEDHNNAVSKFNQDPSPKASKQEKAQLQLKKKITDVLEQIESLELELIKAERNTESSDNIVEFDRNGRVANTVGGHHLTHDLRNKRFIQNQYKLKLNRLNEEYRGLARQWRRIQK